MTSHNVAGTIHGTAGGSDFEITLSTKLSGLFGDAGGKWKEWHGDRIA